MIDMKLEWRLAAAFSIIAMLATLLFVPASSAEDTVKVAFKSTSMPKLHSLDAALPITFILTGGFATKTMDCADITGLQLRIHVSDGNGTDAYYADAERAYEGLWSGWGWETKVTPSGLECTWTYDGKSFVNLNQAYFKDGFWYFAQSWRDGEIKPGFFKAKDFIISWASPKVNYNWSSGRPQEVLGQEGKWTIPVGGSVTPQVSFTGLERGTLVKLPVTVDVQAIGNASLPVTEFDFGPTSSYLLWEKSTSNSEEGKWKQNGKGNCSNPTSSNGSSGAIIFTAKCTYIPNSNYQNKPFRATAYTSDHRAFFSAEVYINTQIMTGFSPPKGEIVIKKDSKGNPVSAIVSGVMGDISPLKSFALCLIGGSDTSQNKEDIYDCTQVQVSETGKFSKVFKLPAKYFLSAAVSIPSPYGFGSDVYPINIFANAENEVYKCQIQGPGCLTKAQKAALNKSKYAEGYSLINASPASLKSAGFYQYFSANKKMTKTNAAKFCQSYFRLASLRSDYFDGWGSNAVSTFIQGCTAAAVKIPYGK